MKNRLILIFEVFLAENKYHREFQKIALRPRMGESEKMTVDIFLNILRTKMHNKISIYFFHFFFPHGTPYKRNFAGVFFFFVIEKSDEICV